MDSSLFAESDDIVRLPLSCSAVTSPAKPLIIPALNLTPILPKHSLTASASQISNSLFHDRLNKIIPNLKQKVALPPYAKHDREHLLRLEEETDIIKKHKSLKAVRLEKLKLKLSESISKSREGAQAMLNQTSPAELVLKHNPVELDKIIDKALIHLNKSRKVPSMDDLFEQKVKGRVRSSIMLLKNTKDPDNLSALSLIHATILRNLRFVEAHIDSCETDHERVVKVNTVDQHGRSALHYAACMGCKEALEMLIMTGGSLRTKDIYGRTPLHYSAFQEDRDVIDMMFLYINKCYKILCDIKERSNIYTVARQVKYRKFRKLKKNQEEVIDRADNHNLVESDETLFVDFKMFDETTRETLSRMEYSVNTSPLVALLKKKGETTKLIDLQDNMGRTALHIAALCNKPQIIRVLLDHDASLMVEDFEGKRPVDLSLSNQITSLMIIRMKEVAKREKTHVQLHLNKE